jgi:hypothetical protein
VIDPDQPPRWWTVEEANEALPRVGDVVERARRAVELSARTRTNGHRRPGTDPAADPGALDDAVRSLAEEGIVLRDPARGLVDFPARAPSGRSYWLCWLVGEPAVEWWHWPEDGFAGRTPLDDPPR